MLGSYYSRKAHANFQNYFFVRNVFFQHIGVKSTSISRKIEVHIELNYHLVFLYTFVTIPMQQT